MTAPETEQRRQHYNLLHHKMRVAHLESLPKPDWTEREMLRQSLSFIANPEQHTTAVFDEEYVQELDEFVRGLTATNPAAAA